MAPTALAPTDFPWFDYTGYTFSLGLDLGGGTALLSGHTASAYDADAGKITVRGDLADQVETAYAKIAAILGAGGFALADAARVVEYVRADTLADYETIESVRGRLLADASPVVNVVSVKSLLRRQALLEIEVTARRSAESPSPFEGLVYLPSTFGTGPDLSSQTAAALDGVAGLLSSRGLDLDAIAKITQYVRRDALDDLPAADEARAARLGGATTALTQVPVTAFRDAGALVQLDVVAYGGPLEAVDPGWPAFAAIAAAPAMRAGRVVFLSGQGGREPRDGGQVKQDDVAGQAEHAYAALAEVLAAAGGGLGDLVKTIEYVSSDGLPGYRAVADVRSRHLSEPYPASTGLVQERLARDGQQLEVDALAVLIERGA